ncbi:hypothetical protein [Alloactinosynnema sp. L-07]|nr:hypothetical protein [Alloactinosynnema sp. L-07]
MTGEQVEQASGDGLDVEGGQIAGHTGGGFSGPIAQGDRDVEPAVGDPGLAVRAGAAVVADGDDRLVYPAGPVECDGDVVAVGAAASRCPVAAAEDGQRDGAEVGLAVADQPGLPQREGVAGVVAPAGVGVHQQAVLEPLGVFVRRDLAVQRSYPRQAASHRRVG